MAQRDHLSEVSHILKSRMASIGQPEQSSGKRTDPTYVQISFFMKDTTRNDLRKWLKNNRYEQSEVLERLIRHLIYGEPIDDLTGG